MHLLLILHIATVMASSDMNYRMTSALSLSAMPKSLETLTGRKQNRHFFGETAKENQFPQHAIIFLKVGPYSFRCGATLISAQWLLTSARCLLSLYYRKAFVVLGSSKTQITLEVDMSGLIVHEEYDDEELRNDIGLIKLPTNVSFNEAIQPCKLPKKSEENKIYDGRSIGAVTWAKFLKQDLLYHATRLFLHGTVIPLNDCKKVLRNHPDERNICVDGTLYKSLCLDDVGGPLIDETENKFIGIASYEHRAQLDCELTIPTVFTRVTSFLSWIENKTGIKPEP